MTTTDTLIALGWQIEPFAGSVGVTVQGALLGAEFTDDQVAAFHALIADSGVVVFPQQNLDDDGHLRLARLLGTPKLPPPYFPLADTSHPEISVISTENGLAYTSDRWHADVTWMAEPPRYSILHMKKRPPAGGDTMWSSQVVAYEWLSEPLRQMLTGLTARHRLPTGDPEYSAVHPVVTRHPITGKCALFVNSVFTERICELTEDESAAVLALLFKHSTKPEFVCRWRWTNGDIAIWDNHFVQHYAINDYGPAARRIHRIEIEGKAPVGA